MSSAIIWFAKQGAEKIGVVTQGRNVSAQRFYQRCGFVTRSVGFWFHRWYSLTGMIE
jgi:dTDP-4-amino-4,6-dideoxy-D-galactose acyltransferase